MKMSGQNVSQGSSLVVFIVSIYIYIPLKSIGPIALLIMYKCHVKTQE